MQVDETIQRANGVLSGAPAADGEIDLRWQAIIEVGEFIESNPEEVWEFVVAWADHEQEDLRDAIATVLLEHLLEYHFDLIFPRVEVHAAASPLFADTFGRCWRFGQSALPQNAVKFDELQQRLTSSSTT